MITHFRFKTFLFFVAGMVSVGNFQLMAQNGVSASLLTDSNLETYTDDASSVDYTSYLKNPSFEVDGIAGWTVKNMVTQNNSVFSVKSGSYYIESWVERGKTIGSASVYQILTGLPEGEYKLTASALHIQQSASGSTVNSGAEQTGAYIYAGVNKTPVTAMKQYEVAFSVIDEGDNIEIGLKAENATGNYLCLDNFKLQYVGAVSVVAYAREVEQLCNQGQEYLDKGIQQTVVETLTTAMNMAKTALQGTGTSEDGSVIYDQKALSEARTTLCEALDAAQASRLLYDNLQVRIDYAQKVVAWWEGTSYKANQLEKLKSEIESASQKQTDYALTSDEINGAINSLNTKIGLVDKKIYCSTSACGTETELNNPSSYWSFERSLQSKHWIVFWEAGYGTSVPASVEAILSRADQVFEFYADSLKFITINQGKSKTDTYKMIIRLRYTDEWEASGSGIDNTIGLLTLSRWAYTSREGQTVAHEIGHCFQYQTHCDNNDWNGWMYNWGSGNYNVFWEMCAQWQAYKYYPTMQFNNEWLTNTLNGLHKHPLAVDLRYNNFFIQDYFCHKHGMDILGRLWNESKSPEDPLQAYMRLTMDAKKSTAEKLEQLNDEMWEYGARMTTFDMDPIRELGKSSIGKRNQTNLTKDDEGFWSPTVGDCIENFGHNAIRLNAPVTAKTVYAEFVGEVGKSGYTLYNKLKAGWKFGFVAMLKDGTRVYGDINTALFKTDLKNPEVLVEFECPANCSHLWFVVSGAPTGYWTRDWIDWDGLEGKKEQWPYKVKFYQTNIQGKANNNTYPAAVEGAQMDSDHLPVALDGIYSITGQLVRKGTTSLEGLSRGIYIVNGKKVVW